MSLALSETCGFNNHIAQQTGSTLLATTQSLLTRAAATLGVAPAVVDELLRFDREIVVSIPVRMDLGQWRQTCCALPR